MKTTTFISVATTICMSVTLLFTSCQQEEKYPTDLTVTTQSETTSKNYSYWYKVSGTITLTSETDSTDSYDVTINDGNMYVSWAETPNTISNYQKYTLQLDFDFFDKDATEKTTKNITKTFGGIGNKYYLTDNTLTLSINGDVTGNSFGYTIDYPKFLSFYKNDSTYGFRNIYYNAKIKLTCTKV